MRKFMTASEMGRKSAQSQRERMGEEEYKAMLIERFKGKRKKGKNKRKTAGDKSS